MDPYQPTTITPVRPAAGPVGQYPAHVPPPAYVPPAGLAAPVPPPPPGRRRGLVAGLAAGAAVVLGGLGAGAFLLLGPKNLVTDEVEAEIVRVTQEQVAVTASGVACPDEIPVSVGSAVTCTAAVDGQTLTYTVTQDDDRGNLTITHDRLLPVAEVEGAVSGQLTAEIGADVIAVCAAEGRTVLVNPPGAAIPCTAVNAADPSRTAGISVRVDEAGTVTYEFT